MTEGATQHTIISSTSLLTCSQNAPKPKTIQNDLNPNNWYCSGHELCGWFEDQSSPEQVEEEQKACGAHRVSGNWQPKHAVYFLACWQLTSLKGLVVIKARHQTINRFTRTTCAVTQMWSPAFAWRWLRPAVQHPSDRESTLDNKMSAMQAGPEPFRASYVTSKTLEYFVKDEGSVV